MSARVRGTLELLRVADDLLHVWNERLRVEAALNARPFAVAIDEDPCRLKRHAIASENGTRAIIDARERQSVSIDEIDHVVRRPVPRDAEEIHAIPELLVRLLDRGGFVVALCSTRSPEPKNHRAITGLGIGRITHQQCRGIDGCVATNGGGHVDRRRSSRSRTARRIKRDQSEHRYDAETRTYVHACNVDASSAVVMPGGREAFVTMATPTKITGKAIAMFAETVSSLKTTPSNTAMAGLIYA